MNTTNLTIETNDLWQRVKTICLSTIQNADTILVVKDGNIIEQGNHEKLIRAGGFYSSLYNSQFS